MWSDTSGAFEGSVYIQPARGRTSKTSIVEGLCFITADAKWWYGGHLRPYVRHSYQPASLSSVVVGSLTADYMESGADVVVYRQMMRNGSRGWWRCTGKRRVRQGTVARARYRRGSGLAREFDIPAEKTLGSDRDTWE